MAQGNAILYVQDPWVKTESLFFDSLNCGNICGVWLLFQWLRTCVYAFLFVSRWRGGQLCCRCAATKRTLGIVCCLGLKARAPPLCWTGTGRKRGKAARSQRDLEALSVCRSEASETLRPCIERRLQRTTQGITAAEHTVQVQQTQRNSLSWVEEVGDDTKLGQRKKTCTVKEQVLWRAFLAHSSISDIFVS